MPGADLLDLFVCPKCRGALAHREEPPAFLCRPCRLVFAIIDGIPNFLLEEAQPLEEAG